MTAVTDPMHYLRKERNFLLEISERDGKGLPDRPFTEAELIYRQELRDLPSTASPELDENGQLTNVTWPTKP